MRFAAAASGTAPSNGTLQYVKYNPLNPCSNANPANLDYSQNLFNGGTQNSQQHILQNHTPGGKGPSFHAGDWAAIQALNGSTLNYGALGPASTQSPGTYTLQWSVPQPFDWLGITLYIGNGANGQLTTTNRLVVMNNCSTVVTSYPVS
jgi:hypothetical protein